MPIYQVDLLSGRVIIPHYTVHVSRFSHARAVYLENGERNSKGEKKSLPKKYQNFIRIATTVATPSLTKLFTLPLLLKC